MYSRLFALLSVVLLCSCVMEHEQEVPLITRPVSLSRTQVAVIKGELIKTTKNAVSEWFGKMSAATDGTHIYVCGMFKADTSTGDDAGGGFYFGTLTEGNGGAYLFSPVVYSYSAGYGRTQEGIMRICSLHGTQIEFPLE
ncbi:hypothetical protein GCM10007874_68970 [Labrys miyagiensis]|uniref:Lipoprotein n=1 Tax=Labrys miyagiensis TaxID=346912 RepID=A0ABQ6CU42_9HYPH|nr:hypothetical protein GCM10007874_68970 [Labrys miyagiensis]